MIYSSNKYVGTATAIFGLVVLIYINGVVSRQNVFVHFGSCMRGRSCPDETNYECCNFDNEREITDAKFCMTKE